MFPAPLYNFTKSFKPLPIRPSFVRLTASLRLIDIINKKNGVCYKYREKKPILVYNSSSISDSIKILSDFVGESVPVLNKKSNFMIGIISENDVLKSYTEISNDIRTIEK